MNTLVQKPGNEPGASRTRTCPRLGFLGVGWIGRNRMEAIAHSDVAEIVGIADASPEVKNLAGVIVPDAVLLDSLPDLLDLEIDGLVIATPSAMHAEQSIAALEKGVSVFCQKPLGRSFQETQEVIECARRVDKLLGVDLSYRFVNGIPQLREIVRSGELGKIYSADLVFHNAYGPDKKWFYDPKFSGGGCVIDLGIHLVDLALWILASPRVKDVSSRLFSQGQLLETTADSVEDFALARIDLKHDLTANLSCSWKSHAGCDAVIRATFYGTRGGVEFRNVNGSFYDFVVERFNGTKRETIAAPPDAWSGRAAVHWANRLANGSGYNPDVEGLGEVARTLDRIYGRC